MKLKLITFGIAKDILGAKELELSAENVSSTGDLKNELANRYPDFQKLVQFSLAVNEEYQDDDFQLSEGDEVVIIPPVSGG